MTLSANEFLRRFCMHILPRGFRKIRHYGFLASRNKPRLREHRLQIGISAPKQKTDWKSIVKATMNFDVDQCPHCKTGTMIRILTFDGNGPPKLFLCKPTN